MPWSDETGGSGGWKSNSNNGGPWGQGPRNTGPNPPDLEDLLRRSQDRLKRVLPGGRGGGGIGRGLSPVAIVAIAIVAAALIGYSFFTFRVETDSVGVVLRFGQINRQVGPGLNFRLPAPLEAVYMPAVTKVNTVTIGQVASDRGVGADIPDESLMLTGDENIVDVDFAVLWVINNAQDYLFNLANPEATVKAVAESVMREAVGGSTLEPLLTGARESIESAVRQQMQLTLDSYRAGVTITQVTLLKVDPPQEVIAAFSEVQSAVADQDRARNEAEAYANRVVPEALGRAAQITAAANAYRDQTIAEAQGAADRFTKVLDAYREAPEVTRQRLYLETMERVLAGMNKVLIDDNVGGGVVPYLPLGEVGPAAASAAQPRPAPAATIQQGVR